MLSDCFLSMLEHTDTQVKLFARGLVEWALSVQFARQGSACNQSVRYMELRYEDLLCKPAEKLKELHAFLKLGGSADQIIEAAEKVLREPGGPTPLSCEAEVLEALRGSLIETMLHEAQYPSA
eukprot:4981900-Amphidinium_carterae.1